MHEIFKTVHYKNSFKILTLIKTYLKRRLFNTNRRKVRKWKGTRQRYLSTFQKKNVSANGGVT